MAFLLCCNVLCKIRHDVQSKLSSLSLTAEFALGLNAMITRMKQPICGQGKQDVYRGKMDVSNYPQYLRDVSSYYCIPSNEIDK